MNECILAGVIGFTIGFIIGHTLIYYVRTPIDWMFFNAIMGAIGAASIGILCQEYDILRANWFRVAVLGAIGFSIGSIIGDVITGYPKIGDISGYATRGAIIGAIGGASIGFGFKDKNKIWQISLFSTIGYAIGFTFLYAVIGLTTVQILRDGIIGAICGAFIGLGVYVGDKRVNVKESISEPIVQQYIHIGDKIGTQIKDSVVQRSSIGSGAKKCPNCGREAEANEKFCLECGAKL